MSRRENDEAEATVPERLYAVLFGLCVFLIQLRGPVGRDLLPVTEPGP